MVLIAKHLLLGGQRAARFQRTEEDDVLVAFMTRLSNKVIANDTHFPFDTARVLNTGYFSWSGDPDDPLVCQREGWYNLSLNITTLGTSYGGATNADQLAAIGRNGLDLAHFVVGVRSRAGINAGTSAHLFHVDDDVYLFVDDELHVIFQNPGGSTLLIESNPTDGPDYTTDVGPGTISPHFVIETRSGPPPA